MLTRCLTDQMEALSEHFLVFMMCVCVELHTLSRFTIRTNRIQCEYVLYGRHIRDTCSNKIIKHARIRQNQMNYIYIVETRTT